MKKVLCLISLVLLSSCLFGVSFKKNSTVYVCVKSTSLKAGTGFFSKSTGTVKYGDRLIVEESNNKKSKVKNSSGSVSGWISNGSLTSKKIASTSGDSVVASKSELALAGKGFSADTEKAFKNSGNNLNYDLIDETEKITVSEEELNQFIKEGNLFGGEQ